jgi:hypothetical protein
MESATKTKSLLTMKWLANIVSLLPKKSSTKTLWRLTQGIPSKNYVVADPEIIIENWVPADLEIMSENWVTSDAWNP